ncbi:MAG: creatininase family protein [Candidatus Bathyarchaeota archaeon]|nr:creatininase family protein [Candidatus Bathyarchaeota archaeon]
MATKKQHLWLDELSTFEAAQAAQEGKVIIFPIGSIEEHGEHLPLCTDCIQPEYVAVEVAKKTGALIAPPLRYGICNATRNFPGTLTIQFDTLYHLAHDVLSELVRWGFHRIIVMSGHAGNSHMVALRLAAQDVVAKGEQKQVRIMVLSDFDFAEEVGFKYAASGDGHAGTLETARVMDIAPQLVKSKGKAGVWNLPRFEVVAHPEEYFPEGVNGDPTAASAEIGHKLNMYIIAEVEKLVSALKE